MFRLASALLGCPCEGSCGVLTGFTGFCGGLVGLGCSGHDDGALPRVGSRVHSWFPFTQCSTGISTVPRMVVLRCRRPCQATLSGTLYAQPLAQVRLGIGEYHR